jgi:hypothetical protein
MTDMNNSLNTMANLPGMPGTSGKPKSWFEAMAEAWGKTLDAKASEIQATSDQISGGDNQPAVVTKLQAQSLEMSFMASSSHTSISSVGTALETMARKQ